MNEDYIRERITQLRIQKNISEYKMSIDLGHSKSYIQSISSGRALPSMTEFLIICDYLGITPLEFFDTDNKNVLIINEINSLLKTMSNDDLDIVLSIAKRLNNNIK